MSTKTSLTTTKTMNAGTSRWEKVAIDTSYRDLPVESFRAPMNVTVDVPSPPLSAPMTAHIDADIVFASSLDAPDAFASPSRSRVACFSADGPRGRSTADVPPESRVPGERSRHGTDGEDAVLDEEYFFLGGGFGKLDAIRDMETGIGVVIARRGDGGYRRVPFG